MPELPDALAAAAADLNLTVTRTIQRTSKTLLAAGELAGHRVAIKYLLTDDPFWTAKWFHELNVYQVFADTPPPVRAPRLFYTDNARLMLLDWINGRAVGDDRYPPHVLPQHDCDAAIDSITALNNWHPPGDSFGATFDYHDRFRRYHAGGYLTDRDHESVLRLLAVLGSPQQFNHGDPLAGNILITGRPTTAALVDWEFTGLFLPGFDLAMLHTQLGARTPMVKARIDQIARATDTEAAFVINLVTVLNRELRIHRELSDEPLRARRLPLIEAAWTQARQRLHTLAGVG